MSIVRREPLAVRLPRAVRHIRYGRRHGYPACCIARFTWDMLRNASPGALRGYDGCEWVPCGILHHAPGGPEWLPDGTWRDPDCIECGGEGAPCCDLPDHPPLGVRAWLRWHVTGLRHNLPVAAGYWIRPYDQIGDRRRWRWQNSAPCGRQLPRDLYYALAAAARDHVRRAVQDDLTAKLPPLTPADVDLAKLNGQAAADTPGQLQARLAAERRQAIVPRNRAW